MKRILTFTLVLAMMFALAIPVMAASDPVITFEITVAGTNSGGNPNLYRITIFIDGVAVASGTFTNSAFNGSWGNNFRVNGTQTITAEDGTVYAVSGSSGGTATIVPPAKTEPYIVSITVVAARAGLSVRQINGNQNWYDFTITETIETLWSNGNVDTTSNVINESLLIANNFKGNRIIGTYYNVAFDVKGNTQVRELAIVNFAPRSLPVN